MNPRRAAGFALKKPTFPSLVVLGVWSSLLAGTFVIQGCASRPAPILTSFPASAPSLCIQDANCFSQSIQAKHVALPAGTTDEQAYAKYKSCLLQNDQIVGGPWVSGGSEAQINQQDCFAHMLQ
jgi:hypothetical protein